MTILLIARQNDKLKIRSILLEPNTRRENIFICRKNMARPARTEEKTTHLITLQVSFGIVKERSVE
jgi:hypothetical protein